MAKLGQAGDIISAIIGWTYFFAWSISFYPQVYMDWRRKSVIGLSFDYEVYNLIGFLCYAVFNVLFFWDPSIQDAYKQEHHGKSNLVTLNDVIFALHAVALTVITIFQIIIYEKGGQKVTKLCWVVSAGMIISVGIYLILILAGVNAPKLDWLGLIYWLSYLKLFITIIKYMPQVYLNWKRKSTIGWNIWNVLLDFTGGSLSVAQLFFDAWRKSDWGGISGDPVKFGLGFVSMFFDIIFMVQHYILYRHSNFEEYKPLFTDYEPIRNSEEDQDYYPEEDEENPETIQ